jgi:hypothetical protein
MFAALAGDTFETRRPPMSLTAEQRAAQNRQNARKSTGPKTAGGKSLASANAFRHGLRADVLPIPGEDPAAIAARADAWNDYYLPQSPAAQHLVNECARATVQSDRVAKFQAAALAAQQKEARAAWLDQRAKDVKAQAARLRKKPAEARQQLLSTAAGCRYLIGRWEILQRTLFDRAIWTNREANEVARMLGGVSANEEAWLTRLCAAVVGGVRHRNARQRLFDPGRQPSTLRYTYTPDKPPGLLKAREWLDTMVAAELETLREREAELRASEELPALAEVVELSYVPRATNLARLHLRYQSEARNSFQRAYKSLLTTLDRDAESCDDDSPNEADLLVSEFPEFVATPCQNQSFDSEPVAFQNAQESAPTVSAEVTHDAEPCVSSSVATEIPARPLNPDVSTSESGQEPVSSSAPLAPVLGEECRKEGVYAVCVKPEERSHEPSPRLLGRNGQLACAPLAPVLGREGLSGGTIWTASRYLPGAIRREANL